MKQDLLNKIWSPDSKSLMLVDLSSASARVEAHRSLFTLQRTWLSHYSEIPELNFLINPDAKRLFAGRLKEYNYNIFGQWKPTGHYTGELARPDYLLFFLGSTYDLNKNLDQIKLASYISKSATYLK